MGDKMDLCCSPKSNVLSGCLLVTPSRSYQEGLWTTGSKASLRVSIVDGVEHCWEVHNDAVPYQVHSTIHKPPRPKESFSVSKPSEARLTLEIICFIQKPLELRFYQPLNHLAQKWDVRGLKGERKKWGWW